MINSLNAKENAYLLSCLELDEKIDHFHSCLSDTSL